MTANFHNPKRSPEERAAHREAKLRNRLLQHYLSTGAAEEALAQLRAIVADPDVPARTKVQAARSLASQATALISKAPQFNVAQVSLSAADLLRLVSDGGAPTTTGRMSGGVEPSLPSETPTSGLQCDPRSGEVGPIEGSEPTDGPSERVRSGDASEATPPALRAPVPAETAGRADALCPDCYAVWEDGHERACPVPKEDA